MKTSYQLITIGEDHPLLPDIITAFKQRVSDLGLPADSVTLIDRSNFESDFKSNAPSACLFFSNSKGSQDKDILTRLIEETTFVLPVVPTLDNFSSQVPKELEGINGFALQTIVQVPALVSNLMEALSLLRLSRRLFISYRRLESRAVAIQLYEHLDQCGFDVFLDTHSIKPGESFQDELWHRLVDTDVVVLLDTPEFLKSRWTSEELARASAMSIGILQLIWPGHKPDKGSELCFPKFLKEQDFENNHYNTAKAHLIDSVLVSIASEVESLRARTLAARQDNLIKEFIVAVRAHNIVAELQPERFITVHHKSKDLSIIPTVGVPHAFTYNQIEELIRQIKSGSIPFLIFDQRNIREKWQTHLSWLDQYLPVKSIKITEVDKWLQKI